MFPVGEQRELHQIEKGLRADGRQFARRLAARQAVVRWAAPGRQDFLLAAAAVLAAALAACVAMVVRSLASAVRASLSPGPSALMVIGAKGRPGWDPWQARSGTGPV
ncbi:MAG: DUF3040 domain-containing protein [Streptosporangiaceae bacterium]